MAIKVTTLPGGKRVYVVRWREGGRAHQRTLDRKADAELIESEARRRRQMGALAPSMPSKAPVKELIEEWWEARRSTWTQATRRVRRDVITKWIAPYIGKAKMQDLSPTFIRRWQTEIQSAGAPPTQMNKALEIVSAMCGFLVEEGRLDRNPCLSVRKQPTSIKRPRALLPVEVEAIRLAMKSASDRLMVSLMAYAGLRPGEVRALRWEWISDQLIDIREALSDNTPSTPKTKRLRTVPIIESLRDELAELRKPSGWVISYRGQPIDHHNWRARKWKPAIEKAGIRATPYDLRHTCASLLIHEGLSLPSVAERMGHSIQTCLRDYAHVIDHARLSPSKSMQEAVKEARTNQADRSRPSGADVPLEHDA